MARNKKKFKEWYEQDEYQFEDYDFDGRKDGKRYDRKKENIRNERRNKAKDRDSYLD